MPLVTTPALVLHVMPYGETSKILRLLTRDLGLQSAIARGARRKKARTGPRLDLFAAGTATLLTKGTRELNPLTEFEASNAHAGLAHDVTRFAAASALAELALKCAPADPHAEVFEAALAGLDAIERAPADVADTAALAACWGLVVALGFEPVLDRCAVCGTPLEGALPFSAAQGGVLCGTHRGGHGVTKLAEPDRAALAALLEGRLPDPPLDPRHAAAHRRLLLAFIRHHLAEHRALPALAFWDAEAWNATSS
ncbi:MAG: DNA repair protein RecO [Gemmatimonadetes bacterium GWC2_71_9]|nr:MAG: DNA repair protein RecO [Gemmatimonadetes bacterium GWC2_71_9]